MTNWKVDECRKLITDEKYLASIACVASLYINESKFEEAINLLKGIIETEGTECKIEYKILAHYHLAFCYLYTKYYALAAEHFENVISNRVALKNLTIEHKKDTGNEDIKEYLVNFDEIYHYIGTAYYNLELYDMALNTRNL